MIFVCIYLKDTYTRTAVTITDPDHPARGYVRTYCMYVYVCMYAYIYACIQVSKTSIQVCVSVFFMQIVVYVCM